LYSNNSLFISILLYILPWLHRHGEKATTNITTHHPKIHNQNRKTHIKTRTFHHNPSPKKTSTKNKTTSKAEHFFHHHSSAKFSNSTQKNELEKEKLSWRPPTDPPQLPFNQNYLPTI
jgi:hypothetical protein